MPSAETEIDLQNLYAPKRRHGAEEMDEMRQKEVAYQYLCRLEEAKKWMEAVLHDTLPGATDFEEALRNGVYLAKLANLISPDVVPLSRIYDLNLQRYESYGLQYRHTDNINHWIRFLDQIKLSKQFQPETNDVYNKKNMPRVIYCLHALSRHLFRLGKAPLMSDLYGKAHFTEEEIDAMSKELKKYGLQMPLFQKIGGLLANEIPVDAAALHAAVIAINEALGEGDTSKLMSVLRNPSACLTGIIDVNEKQYYTVMRDAKHEKVMATLSKSQSDSFTADVYDELLTQAEIQGHITSINVLQVWNEVKIAVQNKDEKALLCALRAQVLDLKGVKEQCILLYMTDVTECVQKADNNVIDGLQCRLLLQQAITSGNTRAVEHAKGAEAVWQVNQALSKGGPVDTLRALQNPALCLYELLPEAAPLYHEEMKADKLESGGDLGLMEIRSCIHLLSHLAAVTQAVDTKNSKQMWETLQKFEDMLNLEVSLKEKYLKSLNDCRQKKKADNMPCTMLNFFNIHDCIETVNKQQDTQNQMVMAMHKLNNAVSRDNQQETMSALNLLASAVNETVTKHEAPLYLRLLKEVKASKDEEISELWLQDVAHALITSRQETLEAKMACDCLIKIHRAVKHHDQHALMNALQDSSLNTQLYSDLASAYLKLLLECHKQKVAKEYKCPVVVHLTSNSHKAYLNIEENTFSWEAPESGFEKSPYLSLREVGKLVHLVNEEMKSDENSEVAPTPADDTQVHLLSLIIKIQSWWRGVLARKFVKHLCIERAKEKESQPKNPSEYFKNYVNQVILIQSLWRGRQARRVFQSLVHQPNPPLAVVRNFVSHLVPSADDYNRETKIQQLKSQVVKNIRLNQQLAQLIDDMDVKIGLLIQNRTSLQDVQAHGKNLSDVVDRQGSQELSTTLSKGIKSLTREGRHLLEGYQNLFYLLQTRPQYLSKLLFCLPHSRSMHFLQNVIFTLFNFGSSQRDEYQLLKLLRSALEEEIRNKFQKPIDVLKVYPQVLKIAINFSREHSGKNSLRIILGPLVQSVLDDKALNIETNPVDIYKRWVNFMEMSTGRPSDLPHAVSQEDALKHEEVREHLKKGITALKQQTLRFLDHICSSRDQLPYSLLYTARTLHDALAKRFPGFPEKDLLKVVGNVVYYHFINAAIVAPDAYDIVTLPADKHLTSEERSNLASIAKILQYAASKKGFGEESRHLTCLNPFIIECHEKFKKFLTHCCQVEDLEEHFGVHAFSEATMIVKPSIIIPLQEILETHQLVQQYEDELAPSQNDPLHRLLEDLGPITSVRLLLGGSSSDGFVPKGDLLLTLSNSKFETALSAMSSSEESDQSQLFVMTKELLVSIIPFLPGNNLKTALDAPELPSQEEQFTKQQQNLQKDQSANLRLSKMRVKLWLSQLERQGLVSSKDSYQAILSAIAKDICTRGKYCQAKTKELLMLKTTINSLEQKTQFYQKQVEFYNMYIRTCLENLDTGKKRVHQLRVSSKHPGKVKSHKVLKYTAAQLHSKGVLHQIRNLTPAQFKSVQFEITPTSSVGVFEVKGCFMGIEMERVDIDIQDLLQLQYEGKAIMDMFGKVQINVNLLLFLLNKKFYGKS